MKRTIAISLLLIFLAGQFNLTWAAHYCGSFKVKSSMMLGHSHLDCGMMDTMACEGESTQPLGMVVEKNGCCQTQYFSSDTDILFNGEKTISPLTIDFFIAYSVSLIDFVPQSLDQKFFISHSPPLIQAEKCILYQTFLI